MGCSTSRPSMPSLPTSVVRMPILAPRTLAGIVGSRAALLISSIAAIVSPKKSAALPSAPARGRSTVCSSR